MTVEGVLERDQDLATLFELVERARNGVGGTVVVEGEAGIGKSTLLRAVRAHSGACGLATLVARGAQLEHEFPFGVVRQLLERVLVDDGRSGASGALLRGPAGLAKPVFDEAAASPVTVDAAQSVLRGLLWVMLNLSERSGVALVIDDVHWCDGASLRFLEFLAALIEELPMLLVLSTRPEQAEDLQAFLSRVRATSPAVGLLLAPLSSIATAEIVARSLEHRPQPAFAAAVHQLTGGNPFLIEELASELVKIGLAGRDAEIPRLSKISSDSIRASILHRLTQLGQPRRNVAEAVAILGDRTPLRLIARLLGTDVDLLGEEVDVLAAAHVLTEARPPSFRHPLLRTAVLDSIPPGRSSRLHRAAARLLEEDGAEPFRIATQLLASEPAGDRHMTGVLREAADESLVKGSPESAAAFLGRAVQELPPEDPDRAQVLLELGLALAATNPAAAQQPLIDAASAAQSGDLSALAAEAAAHVMATMGRVRDARDYAETQLAQIEYAGERSVRDLARIVAELHWTVVDRPADAIAAVARYVDWTNGHDDEVIAAAHRAYVLAGLGQDRDLARQLARRAATDDVVLRQVGPDGYSFAAIIFTLAAADDLTEASAQASRALDHARHSGNLTAAANWLMWRSLAGVLAGDLDAAEADARAALTGAAQTHQQIGVPIAAASLASVLIERGELVDASALLEDQSLQLDQHIDDNRQVASALLARATVRLLTARASDALADLDVLAVMFGRSNPAVAEWRSVRALALAATGERAKAVNQAVENLELARRWGAPRSLGLALRVGAMVNADPARRLELLREGAAVLEESESRLERAKASVFLGSELRRQGKRTEAAAALRAGLDRAAECRATGLADFARAELVAAGGRPRRARIVGPDSLTASERRVAQMAAAGMSNREIAEALFVTLKAVTYHLTNCYRKLDIDGRDQLPHALAAPSPSRS